MKLRTILAATVLASVTVPAMAAAERQRLVAPSTADAWADPIAITGHLEYRPGKIKSIHALLYPHTIKRGPGYVSVMVQKEDVDEGSFWQFDCQGNVNTGTIHEDGILSRYYGGSLAEAAAAYVCR